MQGASPSEAMLCRAANLAQLDQKEMLAIREAWFEEVGGPPTGNKCGPPCPCPITLLCCCPLASKTKLSIMPDAVQACKVCTLTWGWQTIY